MDYGIRWARPDEWEQVMEMIWETFQKFDAPDCEPEGRQSFYDFIMDEHLKESFLAGNYKLLVAVDGDEIIGAGSLRNVNHISLLFFRALEAPLSRCSAITCRSSLGSITFPLWHHPTQWIFTKSLAFLW